MRLVVLQLSLVGLHAYAHCQNFDFAQRYSHCSCANSTRFQQSTSVFLVSSMTFLFSRFFWSGWVWVVCLHALMVSAGLQTMYSRSKLKPNNCSSLKDSLLSHFTEVTSGTSVLLHPLSSIAH